MLARHRGPARAEGEMNETDARLRHPWLRINRVLRVMLHTRWSAEAWSQVRVEFRKAVALRSKIRRVGKFNQLEHVPAALSQAPLGYRSDSRVRLGGLHVEMTAGALGPN